MAASTGVQTKAHPTSERMLSMLSKQVPPACGRVAVAVAVVAVLPSLPYCGCFGSALLLPLLPLTSPSSDSIVGLFHSLAGTGDMLHHRRQNLTGISTATRDSAWSQDGRTRGE